MHHEWLKSFSIAIIKQDLTAIDTLIQTMPQTFETQKELEQAQVLIAQALELFEAHAAKLKASMLKVKKTKKYLE